MKSWLKLALGAALIGAAAAGILSAPRPAFDVAQADALEKGGDAARGKMIFAAGAGLLNALIRAFGGYPEGTTYAIFIMNVLTPLIDRMLRGRIYGEVKTHA